MSAKRLLITGSTGGVGHALDVAARAAGWEVSTLNRADFGSNDFDVRVGCGPFDAVVFCTGCCSVMPLTQLTDETFIETLQVNCGLFLRLMRTVVRLRAYAAAGMKVVALSSVSAREGWPGGSAYCASKGALSALCRALDVELKAKGISVKALEPRYIRTRMFDACAGRMGVDPAKARDPIDFVREIMKEIEV